MFARQTAIGVFVCLALISTIRAEEDFEKQYKDSHSWSSNFFQTICSIDYFKHYVTQCVQINSLGNGHADSTSTTISNGVTQSSVPTDSTMPQFELITTPAPASTPSPSGPPSETEQWCKLENGTSFSQGFSFMDDRCSVCQCLANHSISCKKIFCMLTYCIDGSKAEVREGQCCPQCSYERTPQTCEYKNLTLKHGTAIKRTAENVYCWCQSGSIECRKFYQNTSGSSSSIRSDPLIFTIIIIVAALIFVGLVGCAICGYCFYVSYKNKIQQKETIQAQYENHVGWQEVDEKNLTEQQQQQDEVVEKMPPLYIIHNGPYGS